MRTIPKGLSAILVVGGMLAAGCMDSRPSVDTSNEEATVKGTVTINGKLVKKGTVLFDPSNYQRKFERGREAPISPDGSYEVKTLVGANRVKVGGSEAEKASVAYEEIEYNAPSGTSTLDIRLPKE